MGDFLLDLEVETMPKKTSGAGRGKKKCEKCGEYVGVRSSVCPHCQNPFPVKTAGTKKRSTPTTAMSPAMLFVRECGGIDEARRQIDEVANLLRLAEELKRGVEEGESE